MEKEAGGTEQQEKKAMKMEDMVLTVLTWVTTVCIATGIGFVTIFFMLKACGCGPRQEPPTEIKKEEVNKQEEDTPVFRCALACQKGGRPMAYYQQTGENYTCQCMP